MKDAPPPSPATEMKRAREMVGQIFVHHFRAKPSRVVHQSDGLSNFVFLARQGREEFVIRLSPEPARLNSFIKEQWTIAKAREVGVPTPEVLEVGNEVVPWPYMVARKVEGESATFHPERDRILQEMGRYAAMINTIKTSGFGATFDWSSNQLSHNETWKEFLNNELLLESRLTLLEKQKMLSAQKIAKIRSVLKDAAKLCPKPVLNHGDIRLKNMIVNTRGQVVAVIDWEHSMSNIAPAWELSIALHDLSIDEKMRFLEGYGISDKQFAPLAPVIKALNIVNYARTIERLAAANDTRTLECYRTRLHGSLDLYSL